MKRKIPQITFAEHPDQGRKCWISLSGCNFNCKGCISAGKQGTGRALSVEELVNLIQRSCKFIYNDEVVNRVNLTGGEPTLDLDYFLSSVRELRKMSIKKFEISTNGYLIDEHLLDGLSLLDADILVKLDVKFYDEDLHRWYTGKSNANVLKAVELLHKYASNLRKFGPGFMVRTVYIPEIMTINEIEKIAKFISQIDKNVCYRIQQFSPVHIEEKISRRPTFDEMLSAYNIARKYLNNVVISTYLPTRPEYNYVEIRADELIETFNEIDQKSKTVIESWNVEYFTMNQILRKEK